MPKLIKMPKLSDTMTEGTLIKWLVKEGETVDIGRAVADIETDKATMEMQTFDAGIVHKLLLKEGSKVPLGAGLAVILDKGEASPTDLAAFVKANEDAVPVPAAAPSIKSATGLSATRHAVTAGSVLPTAPAPRSRAASTNGTRVKASPLARKVAVELGVDMSRITGSGPGGRIIRADVESAPASGAGSPLPARSSQTIRPVAGPDDQRIPLTGMRNIIAERLFASKTQIPHFYLQMEIDAAPLMAFRANINEQSQKTSGNKYSVNDFILKAVVRAAVTVPAVNSSFDGDAIVQFKHVNLNVAIALPEGLVTPVIKAAETKTVMEISLAVKDLATRAKNKKLSSDEFGGGTITVSNLGASGIDHFAAIINPPQAAIISVGSVRSCPVVNDKSQIVAGQRMWLGLSGDHRVVDGAVGAQFLGEMKKLLENPALMLV